MATILDNIIQFWWNIPYSWLPRQFHTRQDLIQSKMKFDPYLTSMAGSMFDPAIAILTLKEHCTSIISAKFHWYLSSGSWEKYNNLDDGHLGLVTTSSLTNLERFHGLRNDDHVILRIVYTPYIGTIVVTLAQHNELRTITKWWIYPHGFEMLSTDTLYF